MQNIYQLQSMKYQFLNFSIFFCQLQTRSAKALAKLLELCITREPCPNAKIIKNLCSFACSDPSVTPAVNISLTLASDEPPCHQSLKDSRNQIVTQSLLEEQMHLWNEGTAYSAISTMGFCLLFSSRRYFGLQIV